MFQYVKDISAILRSNIYQPEVGMKCIEKLYIVQDIIHASIIMLLL